MRWLGGAITEVGLKGLGGPTEAVLGTRAAPFLADLLGPTWAATRPDLVGASPPAGERGMGSKRAGWRSEAASAVAAERTPLPQRLHDHPPKSSFRAE